MACLDALDTLSDDSICLILHSWSGFSSCVERLLRGNRDLSVDSNFVSSVNILCKHGLKSLVQDYFFIAVEETFKDNGVSKFWQSFERCVGGKLEMDKYHGNDYHELLCKSLEEICSEKLYLEQCVVILEKALPLDNETAPRGIQMSKLGNTNLLSRYQMMVSSLLLATLPYHFTDILHIYFKAKLKELSGMLSQGFGYAHEGPLMSGLAVGSMNMSLPSVQCSSLEGSCPDTNVSGERKLIHNIGRIVHDLRGLGLTSMTEDAYASAIFSLLKAKICALADDDFRTPLLKSIKKWIHAVPLRFLYALFAYLGEHVSVSDDHSQDHKSPLAFSSSSSFPGVDAPSEGLVRWHLRLEYFAYETLQDLRIRKLFEIIVDYPESSPAIEDLKQCLEYTGQHSKLVDSFISALRYRLLTAGASTNDILHHYVSTIKAFRSIDPSGVFLDAVGEPIKEYLRGRKDTIRCIVTMLTDGAGGNLSLSGDSLLEELNRDNENQENDECDDDFNTDDNQAWISCQRWEPDPVEVDPTMGCRNSRRIDIFGMLVNIIGSRDQLVNEYRAMLAEKLLNKSDYDIDSEIRTSELLKMHFGEGSMQRCEIMLNDIIDSKRTNANVKATMAQPSEKEVSAGKAALSLDILDATIMSSNFWPPIQEESLIVPDAVDQLLSEYAKRYYDIKTPRKLQWMKNLGSVKLELIFDEQTMHITVSPVHASIIMQFQEQTSWSSRKLAGVIGVPVDVLNRRINFWINKGVLVESSQRELGDRIFTIVDHDVATGRDIVASGNCDDHVVVDEDEDTCIASTEEQLREMTVYEKFILGMLTNFGSMAIDRIHNTLKMFCVADPPYDKSLQQLQTFLSSLAAEEKVELRDGMYFLK